MLSQKCQFELTMYFYLKERKMFFLALSIVKAQKQWPTQHSEHSGTLIVVLKYHFPWKVSRAP